MEAIGALREGARDDALFTALDHADAEVVKVALSELARAWGDRVVARVAMCLDHPARDVRKLAADLLGEEGSPGAHAILRARLEGERDPAFRAALNAALAARSPSQGA